ncbi:alpha/beta fold hydrolase [Apibacter raozihei]|uniref:RBBP9/YdeN family alpha/beta hydrolase n=1 Tax=Apibacter raozihei TaxID=2500547 RepID=UPI000FE2F569|nr:alpha/beta fold hydrolase [Apibacter raozihei]
MIIYFNIPGLGGSDTEHWQTYFEKSSESMIRIEQKDWDSPECEDWINTIEKKLQPYYDKHEIVLIGHSLGCATIAHWAKKFKKTIKGALLVAPSDIENPAYTFPANGFTPMPLEKINFKTVVVYSTDDPWVSVERASYFAKCWGSELRSVGNAGHINVASGYGVWEEGQHILKSI